MRARRRRGHGNLELVRHPRATGRERHPDRNSVLSGVNEACSGVRSLQTSLMIGLLFGELKRLVLVRRLLLLAGAVAIAFLANCARALFLVWIAATHNVDAVAKWHDVAGYSIVLVVFGGTIAIATWLSRTKFEDRKLKVDNNERSRQTHSFLPFQISLPSVLLPLAWLFVVEVGVQLWYRAHERDLITATRWSVRWPEEAAAFSRNQNQRRSKSDVAIRCGARSDVAPFVGERPSEPASTMFFFRWNTGNYERLACTRTST